MTTGPLPRCSNAATMLEPMKPAPPVTKNMDVFPYAVKGFVKGQTFIGPPPPRKQQRTCPAYHPSHKSLSTYCGTVRDAGP